MVYLEYLRASKIINSVTFKPLFNFLLIHCIFNISNSLERTQNGGGNYGDYGDNVPLIKSPELELKWYLDTHNMRDVKISEHII